LTGLIFATKLTSSEAVSGAKSREPFENAGGKYCTGENAGPPFTEPRVEILVSKTTVLREL
jgi:hypothetical protein